MVTYENVLEIIRHPVNVKEKIFLSHFIAEKIILYIIIIKCNNIFDTNILSRGYPIKLNNNGNYRG